MRSMIKPTIATPIKGNKICKGPVFSRIMSVNISAIFSDSETDKSPNRVTQENEKPPGESPESLIPSTSVQANGSVTVHRKHRKIVASSSRRKMKNVSALKELKHSNKSLAEKLKKTEKRIRKMEDRLRATRTNKGKSSYVPNGVKVIATCNCLDS